MKGNGGKEENEEDEKSPISSSTDANHSYASTNQTENEAQIWSVIVQMKKVYDESSQITFDVEVGIGDENAKSIADTGSTTSEIGKLAFDFRL